MLKDIHLYSINIRSEDKDECSDKPCAYRGECTNLPGDYSCKCQKGYDGSGYMCTNGDQCGKKEKFQIFHKTIFKYNFILYGVR